VKRAKVNSETASIQKQLAEAQKEAQDAMGEFRSWGNPYYEKVWLEAVEKVRRLEREIVKRKMR
jgi:hypothetical protein